MLSHLLVGQQHEFLYQPVGLFRFLDIDAYGLGILVQLELHLLGLEVDGAVLIPLLAQDGGQFVQLQNGTACRSLLRLHVAGLYYLLRLFVVVAVVAVDNALAHPHLQHRCLAVHLHHHAETKLVLVRPQRADAVAQLLWQHGDGAVHQIHARSSLVGLAVNCRAGFYIVRHIGDVYAHLHVAVFHCPEGQGIVKVLGIGGVDSERRDRAEVFPSLIVFLGGRGDALGLLLGFGGEIEREVVLGQDGLHLHVVVAGLAQPFHHAAHGVVHPLGPVGHLHQHLLAVLRPRQIVQGDEDVDHHGAAVADHEGKAALHLNRAHKACAGTLQHFDNLPLGLVHFALREHQHFDRVAMQCVAGIVRGNQHILSAFLLGNDIGLAGLLHVDCAHHVVLGQQIVVNVLGINLILAAGIPVLNQNLGFGQFQYCGRHQLAAALVMCPHPRRHLLVVERLEGVVGKYFQYLFGIDIVHKCFVI